jgi:hypothetical protein
MRVYSGPGLTLPKNVQQLLDHTSILLTFDRYSHWMPSMGRHAADGMDEPLGENLLVPYCCQGPRCPCRGLLVFIGFAGKIKS